MYRRILVKLSGEALSGDKSGILDSEALLNTCKSIKAIYDEGVQVTIVVGAGNICRGGLIEKTGFDRVTGDYMGMLGTVINSFAIKETLNKVGVKAVVLSAVKMEQFTETYSPELADEYLNKGYVCVFGGGTGKPFFTTDTCTGTTQGIEDYHAVAKQGKGATLSTPKIQCQDTSKANGTTQKLSKRQLVGLKEKTGKKHQDKDTQGIQNSSSAALTMRQSDVETRIVQRCIQQRENQKKKSAP